MRQKKGHEPIIKAHIDPFEWSFQFKLRELMVIVMIEHKRK